MCLTYYSDLDLKLTIKHGKIIHLKESLLDKSLSTIPVVQSHLGHFDGHQWIIFAQNFTRMLARDFLELIGAFLAASVVTYPLGRFLPRGAEAIR